MLEHTVSDLTVAAQRQMLQLVPAFVLCVFAERLNQYIAASLWHVSRVAQLITSPGRQLRFVSIKGLVLFLLVTEM